jgi:dihydroorotate dehydrogenase (NAD+) catalytic subunit
VPTRSWSATPSPPRCPTAGPAGLSGPAVRPLALRCVAEVCAAFPEAHVVGGGGIATVDDARSFLAAGATAVQVGTALLHDPTAAARLIAALTQETVS